MRCFSSIKKTLFLITAVVGGFILIIMRTNTLRNVDTEKVTVPHTKWTEDMRLAVTFSLHNDLNNSKGRQLGRKMEQLKLSSTASTINRTPKSTKTWKNPDDNPAYFKRRAERMTPVDFNFIISSDICEKGPTDLLIMVISMAAHRDYRNAIRETWGSVNHNNTWAGTMLSKTVRLVFLFGITSNESQTTELKKESLEKHDIVLADFKEDYFNLTYKVLTGFKWVKMYCRDAKFVMKNDEDSIVHIPWLLERLKLPEWNSKIIGPYFTNQIRYTAGKFAVSQDSYPFYFYPPHVKGNVYIMPTNTSLKLLEVAEYMPYVNMEDVHITGILAKVIGATHMGISRREYNPSGRPDVCDVTKRRKFAGRDVSASYARDIWKKILDPKSCK